MFSFYSPSVKAFEIQFPRLVLADKVAVVTGSGGAGCGRAIARRLARDGASLVASDINEDGGCETIRQIEAAGGRAAFFRADVRSEADMRALVEFAVRRFGGLTLLVNNASGGIHEPGGFFDHFAATLQIELFGTLYATRFAMEAIRRSGGGAIVNMSSISGLWHGR
jgi:NAD(P)-dependent dehydrogenase (short-subunit alcohol dehydrogenase family)